MPPPLEKACNCDDAGDDRKDASDQRERTARSSFRDWCGDETDTPRDIAEMTLSHAVGDTTERAHRRAKALARRRELMQQWADFLGA